MRASRVYTYIVYRIRHVLPRLTSLDRRSRGLRSWGCKADAATAWETSADVAAAEKAARHRRLITHA